MQTLSINLPFARRLDLRLVKDRGLADDPLWPKFKSIFKVKRRSKIALVFGTIFDFNKIRRIAGKGLLLAILAVPLLPRYSSAATIYSVDTAKLDAPVIINTRTSLHMPAKSIKITTRFSNFHPGIDLDGVTGDPIYSVIRGKVEMSGYLKNGYGNAILINHGSGTKTFYAHLLKIYVREGDNVDEGTIIGLMGSTGRSFGDHLHFEVYENGKRINPLSILPFEKPNLASK